MDHNAMTQPAKTAYRLAIFDVDGTLLNTRKGILTALRYATDAYELPPVPKEKERFFIGPPMPQTLMWHYGMDMQRAKEIAEVFRTRYGDVDLGKGAPYPGIAEVLETLHNRGITIAVATNKRDDYTERILTMFGLDRYVDIRHGVDIARTLHKSDLIRLCVEDAGVEKASAVMIGDSMTDAEGAKLAGVSLIGVTYGFGFMNAEEVRAAGGLPCESVPGILEYFGGRA